MKYALHVLILFSLCACKSAVNQLRNSDLSVMQGTVITAIASVVDSMQRSISRRLQSELDEWVYIREYYQSEPGDTVPRVKSETTIRRRERQQSDTDIRESGIRTEQQSAAATDSIRIKSTASEQTISLTDSRPVQGGEWLYLSLGIGIIVIIAIVLLIAYVKRKVPP